jgi:aromatic-L-amino-acid decarboxylase
VSSAGFARGGGFADIGDLPARAAAFIAARLAHTPLGVDSTLGDVPPAFDGAITDVGLGVDAAWSRFIDQVAPANLGLASERFLAFIPAAPTPAGVWMDAAVSAASFSAESWLEAPGVIAAENEALAFLADAADLPPGAAGCFVSGGSMGNLSALAVGRERAGGRRLVAVADTAHASVHNSLHLLGLTALAVPTGPDGRMTGDALRDAVGDGHDVGIVVASGGSTNAGVVDDLHGVAGVSAELEAWFHVDAAYGGAALLLPEKRSLFAGIGRADSVIIDPHKWLFAPVGSCALLYRRPHLAAAVHTQHGPYLDVLHTGDRVWNPADLAYQLTRRASGLPLWFALAVHGVGAHRVAVRRAVELAMALTDALVACPVAEPLMVPQLGVVLFRRSGWAADEWRAWAAALLRAGTAFVAPTTWRGEPVGRVVFLHPDTPDSIVEELVASL